MNYLLDTNICIYLMKGGYPKIEERLMICRPDEVVLSSIVASELMFGAENSQNREKNLKQLKNFLSGFYILPYGSEPLESYGQIRACLRRSGQLIGAADMFIAAQVLAYNLVLITNNEKEFSRVPNLKTENWLV